MSYYSQKLQNEIFKAKEIAHFIKLDSDFNKSIEIIGRYPALVQLFKITEIMSDNYTKMYNKTKNKSLLTMRDGSVNSLEGEYIYTYEQSGEIGLQSMIQDLKEILLPQELKEYLADSE